jgi:hypothetical protein
MLIRASVVSAMRAEVRASGRRQPARPALRLHHLLDVVDGQPHRRCIF